MIISNPPYIPSAEIAALQPEVRDFDPRAALDGGADGLDFYRKLAAEAKPFLKPDGKIMLEFGDGQAEAVKNIFEDAKVDCRSGEGRLQSARQNFSGTGVSPVSFCFSSHGRDARATNKHGKFFDQRRRAAARRG